MMDEKEDIQDTKPSGTSTDFNSGLVSTPETPAEVVPVVPKPLPVKAKDTSPRQSPRPPEAMARSFANAPRPEPVVVTRVSGNAADIVEDWFRAHFQNVHWTGNSQIYNKLHEAKKDLIKRLGGGR